MATLATRALAGTEPTTARRATQVLLERMATLATQEIVAVEPRLVTQATAGQAATLALMVRVRVRAALVALVATVLLATLAHKEPLVQQARLVQTEVLGLVLYLVDITHLLAALGALEVQVEQAV